jgi:hypothetical protein
MSGDVFDLLLSLSDFGEFKALMLEHKRFDANRALVFFNVASSRSALV